MAGGKGRTVALGVSKRGAGCVDVKGEAVLAKFSVFFVL